MKSIPFFLLFFLCFFQKNTIAQSLISSQQCYGGGQIDVGFWGGVAADGSRFFGGMTSSSGGDVSGLHNNSTDGWLVKTNASGAIQYQRCIGGSDFELANAGTATASGGIVAGGQAYSNDGDFAGQNKGACDAFVTKVNSDGSLAWAKLWGGTQCDLFEAVWPIASGGYLAGGETASNDGDVVGYKGGSADFWLVRTDENGNALWKKTFGGSDLDRCYDLWKTNDGNFIVTGETASNDGDFPATNGSRDVVLMKINPNGGIIWAKTFGGNGLDRGVAVRQRPSGEYVVLASTGSTNGQVSGFHGFRDFWVFTTDANGNFQSQRCLGGTGAEDPFSMELLSDGSILVGGSTSSTDGDVVNPSNLSGWLVKLDVSLEIQWARVFGNNSGGAFSNSINAVAPLPDGGVFAMSSPESAGGDVTCNKGGSDIWAFTLSPAVDIGEVFNDFDFRLAPNPTDNFLQILGENLDSESINVLIFNALGQKQLETNGTLDDVNTTLRQHMGHWPGGFYALQIRLRNTASTQFFVKN
jgi:hypothetical protein